MADGGVFNLFEIVTIFVILFDGFSGAEIYGSLFPPYNNKLKKAIATLFHISDSFFPLRIQFISIWT